MKTKSTFRGILSLVSFTGITLGTLLSFVGCDNKDYSNDSPFDNVVYLDAAELKDVSNFTFNRTIETGQQIISAQLARPAANDINVGIKVAPSLVDVYNARLGANYAMLDAQYYKLSAQQTVIPQGKITSDPVTVDFLSLTDLDIDASYLLPVTIDQVSGGMGILNGSKTICYIVRRSSAITTAVSLKNNYFEVPGFEAGNPTADVVNNMTQLTFEAIIRVNDFKGSGAIAKEISTIMGIEQYCLFRIGDAGFPAQQLQFSCQENKFPNADNSKLLQPNEWYHVAVVYDTEKKTAAMYVDGREQSSIEDYGTGEPINLGMQKPGDFKFKIGHSYGEPDDMSRQLDGEICEVRVWNVARSQQEIFDNMYNIEDPTNTPGLQAYWKFNEGEGDIAKDYTGHGNDAKAYAKATWPAGIEVTQKNKE